MKISDKGLELIEKFEGFRAEPYLDAAGVATIGVGSTHYDDGVAVTMKDKSITRDEAIAMLKYQIDDLYGAATNRYLDRPVTQNQFDAMVSFAYNLGTGALKHSTLLRMVNKGHFETAANQFGRWDHAAGVKLAGLTKRREAEAELFRRS